MGNQDNAEALFREGYNCCQAVLIACGADLEISKDVAIRLAQPFGGGMSHLGQTCGAVTGAMMVIGLKFARTDLDGRAKKACIEATQQFVKEFTARHDSINCTKLLGVDLGDPAGVQTFIKSGLRDKVCVGLVRSAAEIVEKLTT